MPNLKNNAFRSVALVLLGLVINTVVCLAAQPHAKAEAAFEQGDFATAIQEYEAAIASGGSSAGLYENLATAQSKAGQRPQAVLSLHRAILLHPQGMDARMALSDLERSLGLPHISDGWRERVAEKVPLLPLIIVGCAILWLGAFLLLSFGCRKCWRFWPVTVAVLCLLAGGALAAAGFLSDPRWMQRDTAVVVGESGLKLLSAPADQSETVASLPGGATVRILRRSGDWLYARTPDGRTGWAPTPSLEAVVPAS